MTTKNLVGLAVAAVVLGGAAYMCGSGRKIKTSSLNGKSVVAAFDVADVARVEIGGAKKLALVATDKGWTVETLFGYPADTAKIRENLLKLVELKVGQVAPGIKLASPTLVEVKDAKGKSLASATLGEPHRAKPKGESAMYGGYPDGRYVKYGDKVVLVKDALDAYDGDFKKWIDPRICAVPSADVKAVTFAHGKDKVELTKKDSTWTLKGLGPKEELDTSKTYSLDSALSYLDLTGVADPKLSAAELGFATGSVYTVALKDGKTYTASVGNAKDGDRYFKVAASFTAVGTNKTENAALEKAVADFNAKTAQWVYTIGSYSADSMAKTRKDLVKAKAEEKAKDEKKNSKAK